MAMNRCYFLRSSLGVAALAGTGRLAAAERKSSIRLGGPAFAKTDDPEELALLQRKLG